MKDICSVFPRLQSRGPIEASAEVPSAVSRTFPRLQSRGPIEATGRLAALALDFDISAATEPRPH